MEKTIGQTIKEIRCILGVSQEDFAKQLGICKSKLISIENDKVNIEFLILQVLCKKLNLDSEVSKKLYNHFFYCDIPGVIIKNARIKAGFSHQDLSVLTGISRCNLITLENNPSKRASLKTLRLLEQPLNLDLEVLKELYGYYASCNNPSNPGHLIKKARIKANLTQKELSVLTGIPIKSIVDLEFNRVSYPKLSTLQILCQHLDLDLETLKKLYHHN